MISRNRQKMQKAMVKAMRVESEGWDIKQTKDFIQKVGDIDFLRSFLNLTGQFNLKTIEGRDVRPGYIIPQTLTVNTETSLDLENSISNGELIFKRKQYQDSLNSEFNKRFKPKGSKKK